jgi:hypothetical protein
VEIVDYRIQQWSVVLKEKLSEGSVESKLHTLSDSDIVSKPNVSRRTLLATLGLGAGAALATSLGTVTPIAAADAKKKPKAKAPKKKPAPKETDSD